MYRISKINKPLKNLLKLIGMKDVKKTIFYQLMYFIQNLHDGKLDMLHTIIQGPPGVGKTELGKILCDLYSSLGVLKNKKYVIAKRSDLIGGYLGQTALKTQAVIDKAKGGVLFIDEAYSLGDPDKKDSFSKECIDTLNLNLTENKHHMMCIIAGYKNCLERSFFSHNEGLKRRFNFCMNIEKYNYNELQEIFLSKLKDGEWKIKEPLVKHCPIHFFRENAKYFPFFGGDIENFIFCIKMEHSMNLLKKKRKKKVITIDDLKDGFEMYKINNQKNIEDKNTSFIKMYI
jgi:SpoVK/Ycf46/Vps4 family AAA+-type ATPase